MKVSPRPFPADFTRESGFKKGFSLVKWLSDFRGFEVTQELRGFEGLGFRAIWRARAQDAIMAPFWIPIAIRHLVFRVPPKRESSF